MTGSIPEKSGVGEQSAVGGEAGSVVSEKDGEAGNAEEGEKQVTD